MHPYIVEIRSVIPLQVATGLLNGSMHPLNYLLQTFGSVPLRLQVESIGEYDGNATQEIINFITERLETKLIFHALMPYLCHSCYLEV